MRRYIHVCVGLYIRETDFVEGVELGQSEKEALCVQRSAVPRDRSFLVFLQLTERRNLATEEQQRDVQGRHVENGRRGSSSTESNRWMGF